MSGSTATAFRPLDCVHLARAVGERAIVFHGVHLRRRRLLLTTLTELSAIAALATTGLSSDAESRKQHAGGDRNSDDVVDHRPEEILANRAHRSARQRNRVGDAAEVGTHERDLARVDRDVGAGADGDADVRPRQRRRVVDAVADHRDHAAFTPGGARPRRSCRPGGRFADTFAMPASPAIACAVRSLSPVSITTSSPSCAERAIAGADVASHLIRDGDHAEHAVRHARRTPASSPPATVASPPRRSPLESFPPRRRTTRCRRALPVRPRARALRVPRSALNPIGRPSRDAPLVGEIHDRPRDRMLRQSLDARRAPRAAPPRRRPLAGTMSVTVGRPVVMVPVLSSTPSSTLPARSSASPPLISTPRSAPLPVATMTAVGTARPHRARTRDDQHRHARGDRLRGVFARPPAASQTTSVASAIDEDHGNEHAAHAIGETLNRRARRLRVAHELHDSAPARCLRRASSRE